MIKRDVLDNMNPAAAFLYFVIAIITAAALFHPAVSIIALAGGLAYGIWLHGKKAVKFFMTFPLLIGLITVLVNGLFVHQGITPLFYLGQNPVTKEALVYGICAALMMAAVLMWFYCMGIVMTSDKFIYIFGKIMPAASLMFSMTMRFVPRFTAQAGRISRARKAMGCSDGEKVQGGLKTMSIMTTWALENSIDTADSMKARGYGRPGRTAYRLFRWRSEDIVFLIASGSALTAAILGGIQFRCYPIIRHQEPVFGLAAAAILFFIPILMDLWEEARWTYLRSKI